MKHHRTIRKMMKWGGAMVTVLSVVLWIGSAWRFLRLRVTDAYTLVAVAGRLTIYHIGNNLNMSRFECSEQDFLLHWLPEGEWRSGTYWQVTIPFWPFFGAAALTCTTAWRLDALARRAGLNLCVKCNYDRTGLASGAMCPECGTRPESV